MKRTFACVLLLGALAGCGPVQSTAFLIDSQVQLEAAKTAGAPKYDPYDWTAANLYLHEARVEVGYSNYDVALEYARKASTFARQAKQEAIAKANAEIGPNGEPAPDQTGPTGPDAAPPPDAVQVTPEPAPSTPAPAPAPSTPDTTGGTHP